MVDLRRESRGRYTHGYVKALPPISLVVSSGIVDRRNYCPRESVPTKHRLINSRFEHRTFASTFTVMLIHLSPSRFTSSFIEEKKAWRAGTSENERNDALLDSIRFYRVFSFSLSTRADRSACVRTRKRWSSRDDRSADNQRAEDRVVNRTVKRYTGIARWGGGGGGGGGG